MPADLVVEDLTPCSDVVGAVPDLAEAGWVWGEGDTFLLDGTLPIIWSVSPAAIFVVDVWGAVWFDFAEVGVGEVDCFVVEGFGEFFEAVGGEFVVVVYFDEDLTLGVLAGEVFEFADVGGFTRVGDDAELGDCEEGSEAVWGYVSVGDDDPFEVLDGLG